MRSAAWRAACQARSARSTAATNAGACVPPGNASVSRACASANASTNRAVLGTDDVGEGGQPQHGHGIALVGGVRAAQRIEPAPGVRPDQVRTGRRGGSGGQRCGARGAAAAQARPALRLGDRDHDARDHQHRRSQQHEDPRDGGQPDQHAAPDQQDAAVGGDRQRDEHGHEREHHAAPRVVAVVIRPPGHPAAPGVGLLPQPPPIGERCGVGRRERRHPRRVTMVAHVSLVPHPGGVRTGPIECRPVAFRRDHRIRSTPQQRGARRVPQGAGRQPG